MVFFLFFSFFLLQVGFANIENKNIYHLKVELDTLKNQLKGQINSTYFNFSSDNLTELYLHLYFNAFQPEAAMDFFNRSIPDPDPRIKDKIQNLKKSELGFQKLNEVKINQELVEVEINGTLAKIKLKNVLKPKEKVEIFINFVTQIPVQIRRAGRKNEENIAYSLAQWYPKIAKYDERAWQILPYIGREFYADFADYLVELTVPESLIVAGTGVLKEIKNVKKNKKTWIFEAEQVHDVAFALDPDFEQLTTIKNDTEFNFFYKKNLKNIKSWAFLQEKIPELLPFIEEKLGKYPYPQYSFIQAGDGGMEYPMATFILGNLTAEDLLNLAIHEWLHAWFQTVVANDELYEAWMDEGFVTYLHVLADQKLKNTKIPDFSVLQERWHLHLNRENCEPLSTPSYLFASNANFKHAVYTQAALFLHQLSYIIGKDAFDLGLKTYFLTYQFKHPKVLDFRRTMEQAAGFPLQWYFDLALNTCKKIDIEIEKIIPKNNQKTLIFLSKKTDFFMPIDLQVTTQKGSKLYYIPLDLMWGGKKTDAYLDLPLIRQKAWIFTQKTYILELDVPISEIISVEIDPSKRLMNINFQDNIKILN